MFYCVTRRIDTSIIILLCTYISINKSVFLWQFIGALDEMVQELAGYPRLVKKSNNFAYLLHLMSDSFVLFCL